LCFFVSDVAEQTGSHAATTPLLELKEDPDNEDAKAALLLQIQTAIRQQPES
jgi:hypothetical protein